MKPEGLTVSVVEVPDPPSHAQEEALIADDVQAANLYLTNFLVRKLDGAPIVGIATEWKTTGKGNGMFVLAEGPIKTPEDLAGRRGWRGRVPSREPRSRVVPATANRPRPVPESVSSAPG